MSYKFYPHQRSSAPGYPQMEMIIKESPTTNGTDNRNIEYVKLSMAIQESLPETTTLSHPWPYGDPGKVCAGKIALQLMENERVIAFTFGGEMLIIPGNGVTLFTLKSPAPILKLGDFNQIPTILANEVAILLAKRRVEELPDLSSYNESLLCTDPLELYCSCLKALRVKFMDLSLPESPSMFAFANFLITEIETLRSANLWPNRVQEIEDLL